MKKLTNMIAKLIVMFALVVSLIFVYDYDPSRDIMGVKVFYNESDKSLILGVNKDVHDGDMIVALQDEQAVYGELSEKDSYDEIKTETMPIVITEGVIYKAIIKMSIKVIALLGVLLSVIFKMVSNKNK